MSSGNRPHDLERTYVWAVMDAGGDYTVGGQIPEPATIATLLAGAAALMLRRRRKR